MVITHIAVMYSEQMVSCISGNEKIRCLTENKMRSTCHPRVKALRLVDENIASVSASSIGASVLRFLQGKTMGMYSKVDSFGRDSNGKVDQLQFKRYTMYLTSVLQAI